MFTGGEHVRVPNPADGDEVEAIYLAPAEPSRRRAEWVWVRYLEGRDEGVNARVRFEDVQA